MRGLMDEILDYLLNSYSVENSDVDKYDDMLNNIENYYKFWENPEFSLEKDRPAEKEINNLYKKLIKFFTVYIKVLAKDKDEQEYVKFLNEKHSFLLENKENIIDNLKDFEFYEIVEGLPYNEVFRFYYDVQDGEILPEIFELAFFKACWQYCNSCQKDTDKNTIVRFIDNNPTKGGRIPNIYALIAYADSYFRMEGKETFTKLKELVPIEDLYEWLRCNDKIFLKHIAEKCIHKNKVTIYRGINYNEGIVDKNQGFSWSLSIDTARYFALRFFPETKKGIVFKGEADVSDIILYIPMRKEEEILIEPSKVKIMEDFIVEEGDRCSLDESIRRNREHGIYWSVNKSFT